MKLLNHTLFRAISIVFVFALTGQSTFASTSGATGPSSEPLVQASDLVYAGAFRVPEGTTNQTSFYFGGTAISSNPANNSLYIVGHAWYQLMGEISIPAVQDSTNIADLPTASLLQPLTDPFEGRRLLVNPQNPQNGQYVGGSLVYQGRLILSVYSYYDGSGTQVASHFARPLNLSVTGQVVGPVRVGSQYPGFVSGYMTFVPPEWQSLLGGPAITGNCCLNIISYQSNGPAASTFDPAQIGVKDPVPATPLVGYPYKEPLDGYGSEGSFFNGTTKITGVVFPVGTRSLLFFGRQGMGKFCYGQGTTVSPPPSGECYDPADSSKGTHAFPYIYRIWAYDANDLAKVAAGVETQYAVRPYAVWPLTLPFADPNSQHQLGGVAYDPKTGRIYVSQSCVDKGCAPLIDVLQLTKVAPIPMPPESLKVN